MELKWQPPEMGGGPHCSNYLRLKAKIMKWSAWTLCRGACLGEERTGKNADVGKDFFHLKDKIDGKEVSGDETEGG
jgi:hypothetical protein